MLRRLHRVDRRLAYVVYNDEETRFAMPVTRIAVEIVPKAANVESYVAFERQ
jgi:hypothetical protein